MPYDASVSRTSEQLTQIATFALAASQRAGADSCDVLVARSEDYEIKVADGHVLCLTQATCKSMGLRVFVGGRLGFCTTTDLRPEAIERACQQAVALAKESAIDPFNGLAPPAALSDADDSQHLNLYDPQVARLTSAQKRDWAHRIEQAARDADSRVTKFRDTGVSTSIGHQLYASSSGCLYQQPSSDISVWSTPVAEAHGELQTDFWYDSQLHLSDLMPLEEVGRIAATRAARMLGARSVPTQKVPVIFEAPAAAGFIASMLGALDGGLVQKRASFLAQAKDTQIASPHLSVVDDPRRVRGIASTCIDGEGTRTQTRFLVQKGILKTFLYDNYAARKAGTTPTGNARRSTQGLPHTGTFNMEILPGPHHFATLTDVPRALLVTRGLGQGLNTVTGEYSRGAGGLWIEHGEVVHPVQEVTIAGDYLQMLKNIDGVGNEVMWRGAAGAPALRVSEMMVSGQ